MIIREYWVNRQIKAYETPDRTVYHNVVTKQVVVQFKLV